MLASVFFAASPSQESQFKDHVALGAVISDLLLGLFAWSLNHARGTRVEIAAEFEPAATHKAFFPSSGRGIGSRGAREAPALRRWRRFAAQSTACDFRNLLCGFSFVSRPAACGQPAKTSNRADSHHPHSIITMAVVEPELFIKIFCVVMGMYGPSAASREVPSLLVMPARWRNPEAAESPGRRRTSAQASRCSPCRPRW